MHQLSIIIVNYKVPYILGQCLESVRAASRGIDTEVWVIDNASGDGSMDYLRPHYPWVNFIENVDNVGFAKANNQGIQASNAEYILLLNPDTIIAEDTLTSCLAHLKANERCGALGVKMHDMRGQYLRESKRGYPSLWASACKLSGLTALMPDSKLFARYYMGHLDEMEVQSVEVLSCAYCMTRREVLAKIGGLDERFFMYGEDIDFSYRIFLSGYECHYLPTTMIHMKGESSKRNKSQYYKSFYEAMELFYNKYHPDASTLSRGVIRLLIKVYASLAKLPCVRWWFRRSKLKPSGTPVAYSPTLDLKALPVGQAIVLDTTQYTWREVVDLIISGIGQDHPIHFKNKDGEYIAPLL